MTLMDIILRKSVLGRI